MQERENCKYKRMLYFAHPLQRFASIGKLQCLCSFYTPLQVFAAFVIRLPFSDELAEV